MKPAVFLAFVLLSVSAVAADPPQTTPGAGLTVAEAVQQVLRNNDSLREAEDAIAALEARVDQSRSGRLPTVAADLSYARIGPLSEFDIPDLGAFQLYSANSYDAHVDVHYMLYDSRRTARAIELAASQVASAVERKDMVRRDLEFQSAQLFYTILFLQNDCRLQDDHIHMLEEHLETARRKQASGTATELDVLNTQSRLVTAQNQKLELENGLEKQSIMLKRLLGRLDREPLVLDGGLSHQAVALDPEERVAAALRHRPEVQANRSLQKSNAIQYELVGSGDRPVISLNAVAGFKNDYFPHLDAPILNFVLALQAHIPVFDGHLVRYLKAEVAANARGLDHRGLEIAALIRADVLQALADVKASEEALRLVAVHIEQSQKALAFAKASYEAGSVTHLDLIDAIEACSMTRLIELQALYKCVVSTLNLRRATGDAIIPTE